MPNLVRRDRPVEETSELGQHFDCNETVYFCDVGLGKLENRAGRVHRPTKYEVGGQVLYFHFVLAGERDQDLDFGGVLQIAPRRIWQTVEPDEAELNGSPAVSDDFMLVQIRQF